MSENNDGWTAAKLGTQLEVGDERDIKESPSYWWVPYVDDRQVLRALLVVKENYEPEEMRRHLGIFEDVEPPHRAEETELFRKMFRVSTGMAISEALRESDLDRQSAMIGLDKRDDSGGTGKLLRLVDRIEAGYIGYMYGQMGAGKTDFAIYLSELWTRMGSGTLTVGSNIQSFERATTVERYENLPEFIQQDGDVLFVWDEASSNASGYSGEAHEVMDKLRKLLQSFRKNSANLLIIGHTGRDVHPHIRRQANDIIHKESKKQATVYESIKENRPEPEGERFSIEGIEGTSWTFDTKEMSRWFWES